MTTTACSATIQGKNTKSYVSEREQDYYTNKIPNQHYSVKQLTKKALTGNQTTQDSNNLNRAIKILSEKKKGGVLVIDSKENPNKLYLNEIELRSNVHLKIAPDMTLAAWYGKQDKANSAILFKVGTDFPVENVAITNLDVDSTDPRDWYSAELGGGKKKGGRFIFVQGVKNFKFSGVRISDSYTKSSNIAFNSAGSWSKGENKVVPIYGVVKDMLSTDNHVGYGVVQVRSGKHMFFNNLEGKGGITLRLESGQPTQVVDATIDQILGRNIRVTDGDAALNLSPHRINQGIIDVRGIEAVNSTHAVQIAAGFYDRKGGVKNLGVYDSRSVIADIRKVEGGNGAQVKSKDFRYYSCPMQQQLKNQAKGPDGVSTPGQSISVVRDNADPAGGCVSDTSLKNARGCYHLNLELPDPELVSGTLLGDNMVTYQHKSAVRCNASGGKKG